MSTDPGRGPLAFVPGALVHVRGPADEVAKPFRQLASASRSAISRMTSGSQKLSHDAHVELRVKVSNILDANQRSIIDRSNAAWVDVQAAVAREFEPRFAAAKGNDEATATMRKELQERIAADFTLRLDGILSAEQKLVLAEAAAQERVLAANPKKTAAGWRGHIRSRATTSRVATRSWRRSIA